MLPLKDSTSDMAVIARQGSKLVKEVREKKESNKSRQRFWEVAGSKMGKVTGERGRGPCRAEVGAAWQYMRGLPMVRCRSAMSRGCAAEPGQE